MDAEVRMEGIDNKKECECEQNFLKRVCEEEARQQIKKKMVPRNFFF